MKRITWGNIKQSNQMRSRAWIATALLYVVTSLCYGTSPAAQPSISLSAQKNGVILWKIIVVFSSNRECKFDSTSLSTAQCHKLDSLATKLMQDRPKKPGPVYDAPTYELALGDQTFKAEYLPKRECDIEASGHLSCKNIKLPPAQELLVELRNLRSEEAGSLQ